MDATDALVIKRLAFRSSFDNEGTSNFLWVFIKAVMELKAECPANEIFSAAESLTLQLETSGNV